MTHIDEISRNDVIDKDEVLKMAREAGIDEWWDSGNEQREVLQEHLEAFAKLVDAKATAKEREHWKEIVDGQLRCITALNDIVGGEGSTTTKNILDYSRMEERIKEAVLEERKACLKICEAQAPTNYWEGADVCAEAIRARGEA